ncbi:MAG: copper resistance protein CopC [Solirubrobacterales bacterium]|nr:copper resistance protein CopC [Solirubrobacterales bacterium]
MFRPKPVPLVAVLALAALGVLASAPAAWAHAQLLGTSPASGSTVKAQPQEVIFEFNQNVGGTLGAVRVYDAQGKEVDNLNVSHPDGNEHWMGVGLEPHLPDGTYTGTYRVISADTHIVYGGLVFDIGHAGAAPKFTVAGLIGKNRSGKVTEVAFGVVRGLDYLTLALMVGGLVFLLFVWTPALRTLAGSEQRWPLASRVFARRLGRLLAVAIVLGALVSVLGVLLQGACAAGVSLWASLKGSIISNTLDSRFGTVWGLRAIDWVLLGAVLLAARAMHRDAIPVLRAGTEQAGGPTPSARLPRPLLALLGIGSAYLLCTPALAGHASIESPTGVFFPSDVLHVGAASVWVGGIACLLLALPRATRQLDGPERSRLLLAALARFSPIALSCVVVIALTGIIQAYIDVRSVHGLLHSTYGALIIVKTVLLASLIGIGWVNRERVIPALERIVGDGRSPGGIGALARRTLRSELALMLCVFAVTAALISYAPPIDAATGPFSTNTTIGSAELEMTVEPARVGLNTVHLYLIDAGTGAQFTATKELTASARLPAKGIGPLALKANLAGPGHYVLNAAVLSPGGTWEIEITDRVSEFEQFSRTVKVPIR